MRAGAGTARRRRRLPTLSWYGLPRSQRCLACLPAIDPRSDVCRTGCLRDPRRTPHARRHRLDRRDHDGRRLLPDGRPRDRLLAPAAALGAVASHGRGAAPQRACPPPAPRRAGGATAPGTGAGAHPEHGRDARLPRPTGPGTTVDDADRRATPHGDTRGHRRSPGTHPDGPGEHRRGTDPPSPIDPARGPQTAAGRGPGRRCRRGLRGCRRSVGRCPRGLGGFCGGVDRCGRARRPRPADGHRRRPGPSCPPTRTSPCQRGADPSTSASTNSTTRIAIGSSARSKPWLPRGNLISIGTPPPNPRPTGAASPQLRGGCDRRPRADALHRPRNRPKAQSARNESAACG